MKVNLLIRLLASVLILFFEKQIGLGFQQSAYLKADDNVSGTGVFFGNAVGLSGDTAIIGAEGKNCAYIYTRNNSSWSIQSILAPDVGGDFGFSVAISGDTVAIGAYGDNSNAIGINGNPTNSAAPASGAVYVFVRNGTNWTRQAYIKASNTGSGDLFGRSVSLWGETLVVGAYNEDGSAAGVNGNQMSDSETNSGAAYVFVRSGTNWSQQAYLKASNVQSNDWFGFSVATFGDTVVVGAPAEDSNAQGINGNQGDNNAASAGAAYVFTRSGTNWTQTAYLKSHNHREGFGFGWATAMHEETIVVGANSEPFNTMGINGVNGPLPGSGAAYGSGAVFVFVRTNGIWSQQSYIKASNTGTIDNFGNSVSIHHDMLVVGANWEDSNSTGINSNQLDNSFGQSGAAYLFIRDGTNWSQHSYMKASNTGGNDEFGASVAVFEQTILIGAPFEDSNATGVNGDQTNNSRSNAGAVYVFEPAISAIVVSELRSLGNGIFQISLSPPGNGYVLLGATNFTQPMNEWSVIVPLLEIAPGLYQFSDPQPASTTQRFYRVQSP